MACRCGENQEINSNIMKKYIICLCPAVICFGLLLAVCVSACLSVCFGNSGFAQTVKGNSVQTTTQNSSQKSVENQNSTQKKPRIGIAGILIECSTFSPAVTPIDNLSHRGEIVGTFNRFYVEVAVVLLARLCIFKHHTCRNRMCALNVRIIKALHVNRQLVKM